MTTMEERQVAAADLEATLTDWFPDLDALMVHEIAVLAIAAYNRAVDGCDHPDPPEWSVMDGWRCKRCPAVLRLGKWWRPDA
jgi:hypothetical protein